jgi:hypothetical protein
MTKWMAEPGAERRSLPAGYTVVVDVGHDEAGTKPALATGEIRVRDE